LKTAKVRDNVKLDEWVLMPDHLHGIIVITEMWATHRVAPTVKGSAQGPGRGSLGAIIGQYKSCVTRRLRKALDWSSRPVWQRNYYDRIVRSDDELNAIRQYIANNPAAWGLDHGKSVYQDIFPNP
jgi:REP element-mobilizing transposase RayT